MKKILLIILCVLAGAGMLATYLILEEPHVIRTTTIYKSGSSGSGEASNKTNDFVATTVAAPTVSNKSDRFTINLSFIGDCLCATNANTYYENTFNDVAKKKPATYFFKNVSHIFKKDDFTIGDCENVFSSSKGLNVSDKGQYANPSVEAYWFKSPAKNAKILAAGGIDMVSISNNHINDYGQQGHLDTQAALDKAGVKWGQENKTVYFKKNGYKIGVVCASMYNDYAVSSIKALLSKASKKSDFQILYFHGGTESVHKPEPWKVNACHVLMDAGFDLIIGDHPHVLQPLEKYKGKTIIYSMGNFIFGGNRHPENRTIIYQHTLTIKGGNLSSQTGKIIPCYVYTGDTNNWQPDIIKNKTAKKKVLRFMNGKKKLPF